MIVSIIAGVFVGAAVWMILEPHVKKAWAGHRDSVAAREYERERLARKCVRDNAAWLRSDGDGYSTEYSDLPPTWDKAKKYWKYTG